MKTEKEEFNLSDIYEKLTQEETAHYIGQQKQEINQLKLIIEEDVKWKQYYMKLISDLKTLSEPNYE